MADDRDAERIMSQVQLAAVCQAAGDLAEAIRLLEQTLTESERDLGAGHLATAAVQNNLGAGYRASGDVARAIPLLEQAVAGAERALGTADDPVTRRP